MQIVIEDKTVSKQKMFADLMCGAWFTFKAAPGVIYYKATTEKCIIFNKSINNMNITTGISPTIPVDIIEVETVTLKIK